MSGKQELLIIINLRNTKKMWNLNKSVLIKVRNGLFCNNFYLLMSERLYDNPCNVTITTTLCSVSNTEIANNINSDTMDCSTSVPDIDNVQHLLNEQTHFVQNDNFSNDTHDQVISSPNDEEPWPSLELLK